ncbi:MAG: radical SAM/SPASM domain-containing protein [Geobacillus sp.]|nr:MAG: radical SAM/SPASM domain-containing protein [Geobacillus sp.]
MSNMKWFPSRFNAISQTESGELILYNSYTGAIVAVTAEEKKDVLQALKRSGIDRELSPVEKTLAECGFLVPEHANEEKRAQFLHQTLHRTDAMHLIVLPTEACNFRCTYCYQDFSRGKMSRNVVNGLKHFLKNKIPRLEHLTVSWFGGEPLLAYDVIEELSEAIVEWTDRHGVTYQAEMSTNGYFLSKQTLQNLLKYKVNHFMVTLDGSKDVHDARRALANQGSTYETIIHHLLDIQTLDDSFEIYIRINFDEDNLAHIPRFLEELAGYFAGDSRFQIFCRPVGKWGGANDENLPICDHRTAETKIWEFTEFGIHRGLNMSSIIESMLMPTGAVCYAAKPHSFVIGANGQLYKCTCFLHEEYNHVGRLHDDGTMEVDFDKLALWVTSGEEQDGHCQACFFRPACQGNHCPMYRIRKGQRPCPYEKRKIKQVLRLIHAQQSKTKQQ